MSNYRKNYITHKRGRKARRPHSYVKSVGLERFFIRIKRFLFKYVIPRTKILKAEHALKLSRLETEQSRLTKQLAAIGANSTSEKGKKIQEIHDVRCKIDRIIADNGSYYIV